MRKYFLVRPAHTDEQHTRALEIIPGRHKRRQRLRLPQRQCEAERAAGTDLRLHFD
ncbi:hypothetical protein D3C83_189410 [compost metagenome]